MLGKVGDANGGSWEIQPNPSTGAPGADGPLIRRRSNRRTGWEWPLLVPARGSHHSCIGFPISGPWRPGGENGALGVPLWQPSFHSSWMADMNRGSGRNSSRKTSAGLSRPRRPACFRVGRPASNWPTGRSNTSVGFHSGGRVGDFQTGTCTELPRRSRM